MTIICTICARGGSKGLSGKNTKTIAGKPLITWTVQQAIACGVFDFVAVSSDDQEILRLARNAGVDGVFERPDELATDQAGKVPAIVHCALAAETAIGREATIIVDLDVTSPLRATEDIVGAIGLLETTGVSSVITGSPARRSPYFNLVELGEDDVVRQCKPLPQSVLRRQDAPACFDMNASIYVWQRNRLVDAPGVFYDDTRLYVMPEERSHDIDSALDFRFVEMLLLDQARSSQ